MPVKPPQNAPKHAQRAPRVADEVHLTEREGSPSAPWARQGKATPHRPSTVLAVPEKTSTALAPAGALGVAGIAADPASAYMLRLSAASRRTQRGALKAIAAIVAGRDIEPEAFPWQQVTYQVALGIRATLQQRYAVATANRHLAALRGVLKEAWRLGLMTAEEQARASDVADVRGHRLPKGRVITRDEIRALFATCAPAEGPSAVDVRDAAMLAMLRYCGLRRSEVVNAKLADYDPSTGRFSVVGKGNKERRVKVGANGRKYLDAWLAIRPKGAPSSTAPAGPAIDTYGVDDGTILTHVNLPKRLSSAALYLTLAQRAEAAGIAAETIAPHDFRRTFISDLFDANVDVSSIQRIVGHADAGTTQRYDRRNQDRVADAADLLE